MTVPSAGDARHTRDREVRSTDGHPPATAPTLFGDELGCAKHDGHPVFEYPLSGDSDVADEQETVRVRAGNDELEFVFRKLGRANILFVRRALHAQQWTHATHDNIDQPRPEGGPAARTDRDTHKYLHSGLAVQRCPTDPDEINLHPERSLPRAQQHPLSFSAAESTRRPTSRRASGRRPTCGHLDLDRPQALRPAGTFSHLSKPTEENDYFVNSADHRFMHLRLARCCSYWDGIS